jgi:hypothetical protein
VVDLFLYCDLAATHVCARGPMEMDDVHDVVRVIDGLPRDGSIVVDLTAVTADECTLEVLRTELIERADRSTFRVIEPLVAPVIGPLVAPMVVATTALDAA